MDELQQYEEAAGIIKWLSCAVNMMRQKQLMKNN